MLTTKTHRTIREARRELRDWGRFWQRYESHGKCGPSWFLEPSKKDKSNAEYYRRRSYVKGDDRFCAARGAEFPFDATCTATRGTSFEVEREIFVPWRLQGINDFIDSLDSKLSMPLKNKYINEHTLAETYWLDRAEIAVMNRG